MCKVLLPLLCRYNVGAIITLAKMKTINLILLKQMFGAEMVYESICALRYKFNGISIQNLYFRLDAIAHPRQPKN